MDKYENIDLEFFKEQCKKHNLKITPQRILIYRVVSNSQEHPNTENVYNTVKKEFHNISFDTVYRTLLIFSDINLINVVEGFGNSKRFDSNVKNHHHLHCEKCGQIIDFVCKEYDNLTMPKELIKNFKVHRKRVIISGLCKKCQKNK